MYYYSKAEKYIIEIEVNILNTTPFLMFTKLTGTFRELSPY